MMFDLKTENGLAAFNTHLAEFSYATGYTTSTEDANLFTALGSSPDENEYPNIARWYKNIASFEEDEKKSWPSASPSTDKIEVGEKGDENVEDEFDLFDSDDEEEDEEKARITAERLKAYEEKRSNKPAAVAKSNIIFDIKPWDDTINLDEMDSKVRAIETEGLVWGASKKLPVAFGIFRLQICCVVEDDKVSSDWLEEQIMENEDLVQSVDIVAFNKV